jgi:HAMP domain-containing protein
MRRLQFGIRSLINLGFGSLLALCLALTIIAVWALTLINREVAKMDTLSEAGTRIQDVSRDFEIMRGTVQRNRLDGDGSTAAAKDAARHAAELLQTLVRVSVSEERRKMYGDLQVALGQFLERRAALVNLTRNAKAKMATLLTGGDELAAGSEKVIAAARAGGDQSIMALAAKVETELLLVRVASWRLMATQEADGQAAFKTGLAKAGDSIADLGKAALPVDLRALVGTVKGTLDRYAANFEQAAADTIKITALHDDVMVPQLSSMQTVIAAAETSLREEFASARSAVDTTIGTTTGTQEIVGVMALVLGGLFAFRVGRGIVRPITRMTQAMEKLAAGDTTTEIAVGTRITPRPPHRSGHAAFPHPAPTSGV